jgi:hypothetical protein
MERVLIYLTPTGSETARRRSSDHRGAYHRQYSQVRKTNEVKEVVLLRRVILSGSGCPTFAAAFAAKVGRQGTSSLEPA